MGRSYGDAAQCSGGLTVDASGLSHIGEVDDATGTIEVDGGVSLHELMQRIIPAGWFVRVTPGTRYVSVGGAIAADVHGKNHHRDGSFARHVVEHDSGHAHRRRNRVPGHRPRAVLGHRRRYGADRGRGAAPPCG